MENLIIQSTEDTPGVSFDLKTNTMELSGKSYPNNVFVFFEPIMAWLKNYALTPEPGTKFIFRMDYFNTSSAKIIFDILSVINAIRIKGNPVKILWYYKKDDEDMMEAGTEYDKIIETKINTICY